MISSFALFTGILRAKFWFICKLLIFSDITLVGDVLK
jgi:hypothetical protein